MLSRAKYKTEGKKLKRSLICISFFVVGSLANAASFDCAKGATSIEKTICSDSQLSELDSQLLQSYKKAISTSPDADGLKFEQKEWLKNIRNKCTDAGCMKQAYTERISTLTGMSNPSLPSSNGNTGTGMPVASTAGNISILQSRGAGSASAINERPNVQSAKQNLQGDSRPNVSEFHSKWTDSASNIGIRTACVVQIPKTDVQGDEYEKFNRMFDVYSQKFPGTDLAEKIANGECDCENSARHLSKEEWQWRAKCAGDRFYAIRNLHDLASKKHNALVDAARQKEKEEQVASEKAEAQRKKEAEIAEKYKLQHQKEAAIAQKASEEKQAFLNRKKIAIENSHIRTENALVWSDNDPTHNQEPSHLQQISNTNPAECFETLNTLLQSRAEELGTFHPPVKTEFEKSAEFELRMNQAKVKFQSEKPKRDAALHQSFESLLREQLGTVDISDIKYNADSEQFTLKIASSHCHFNFPISIKSSPVNAQQLKTDLAKMQSVVVFEISGDTLIAKHVEIFNKDRLAYTSSFNVPVKYKFNAENVEKWKAIVAKKQREYEKQAAAENQARPLPSGLVSKCVNAALDEGYVDGMCAYSFVNVCVTTQSRNEMNRMLALTKIMDGRVNISGCSSMPTTYVNQFNAEYSRRDKLK